MSCMLKTISLHEPLYALFGTRQKWYLGGVKRNTQQDGSINADNLSGKTVSGLVPVSTHTPSSEGISFYIDFQIC